MDPSDRRRSRAAAAARRRRTIRIRRAALGAVLVATIVVAVMPVSRGYLRDAAALLHSDDSAAPMGGTLTAPVPDSKSETTPYDHLRARGRARDILAVGRRQMGVEYVYGATPRYRWAVSRLGRRVHRSGFDCSSFVAYVYLEALGRWVSGSVAHTDQIWTQGGKMPLSSTADSTSEVIRGMGNRPPRGGWRVGDIIFRREGAGGYWGHVAIVSERGRILESYPPDVHETRTLHQFLKEDGKTLGWMRLRGL